MKDIITQTLNTLVLSLALTLRVHAQESACDFSKYKPLVFSHSLVNVAVTKVEPEYPALGKNVRVQGNVNVKILVDRKGKVVSVCTTDGPPLLRQSAVEAARQWRFKPNFGLEVKQKRKYVQSFITFKFRLS